MTPPSPYRKRVVTFATLRTAVPFVTVATLWLAARGVAGWAATTLSGKASDTVLPLVPLPASLATGPLLAGFPIGNVQPVCASWRTPAVMLVSWTGEGGQITGSLFLCRFGPSCSHLMSCCRILQPHQSSPRTRRCGRRCRTPRLCSMFPSLTGSKLMLTRFGVLVLVVSEIRLPSLS